MNDNIINAIISIIAGLATVIPLVIQLVKYIQKANKEKNWNDLLRLVMNLMSEAEKNFATGAERKKWVMSMVEASASTINYDIDMEAISVLIDSLCALTKKVNVDTIEIANT